MLPRLSGCHSEVELPTLTVLCDQVGKGTNQDWETVKKQKKKKKKKDIWLKETNAKPPTGTCHMPCFRHSVRFLSADLTYLEIM